jgi:hypothetical protein
MRGNTFEKPDMDDRNSKLNVPHSLTTDFRMGHFNTTPVANNSSVTDTFVFSAVTLPVADRPEYLFTEKAVTLRFEGTIVDCFRLGHLAIGPVSDCIMGCQTN